MTWHKTGHLAPSWRAPKFKGQQYSELTDENEGRTCYAKKKNYLALILPLRALFWWREQYQIESLAFLPRRSQIKSPIHFWDIFNVPNLTPVNKFYSWPWRSHIGTLGLCLVHWKLDAKRTTRVITMRSNNYILRKQTFFQIQWE